MEFDLTVSFFQMFRIFCLLIVALTACNLTPHSENSAPSIGDIQKAPIEYQLTYLDTGHLPPANDVNASRIRFLLKTISEKTGDSEKEIADRTVKVTSVLIEEGKPVTNLAFLEEANNYFIAGGPKMRFGDLSALLATQMSK